MFLSFASFVLDTDRCMLSRESRPLDLRPKCYDLLLLLLERKGKVVAKEEIVGQIWNGLAVTDDSLTQCVSELRRALGPDGKRIIRTVPRRGYFLDAAVGLGGRASADAAKSPWRLAGLSQAWPVFAILAAGAAASAAVYLGTEDVRPRTILETSATILDQPVVYPSGAPLISSGIVVLGPGQTSAWHSHPVPLFAYVLRGDIVVDYGPYGTRRLSARTGIMEAVDIPHRATNHSLKTAEIIYISIGAEGMPGRVEEPGPD